MHIYKNWFAYLALSIFLTAIGFALISAGASIGSEAEYPYLWKGGTLLIVFLVWLGISIVSFFGARLKVHHWKIGKIVEIIVVPLILVGAVILRLWVIKNMPVEPSSDFQAYYNIAELLARGVLQEQGDWYCQYITQFPHVIGYPFILSLVFRMFGTSVLNGLFFGLAASLLSILFIYGIARSICGRLGGITALIFASFWPSQILFSNQMASEPIFLCMLLSCIYIITKLLKNDNFENKNMAIYGFLHLFLGIMIALTSAIRPMAAILLIAILICVVGSKGVIEHIQNKSFSMRVLSKGWVRSLLIVCGFLVCSTIINNKIEQAINGKLPGGSVSFGYNLLVGVNTASKGGWNAEDAKTLSDAFNVSKSAEEAHKICRDVAFKRIENNLNGTLNLIFEKYSLLWGNDDYGSEWNLFLLEEQGNATDIRKDLLYDTIGFNNIYYILVLFFAGLSGVFLWKKKGSAAQILVLFFIGTAVIHMLVESQNRYHYHILSIFAILAGLGVSQIFRSYCIAKETGAVQQTKKIVEESEDEAAVSILKQQDTAAMENISKTEFDMIKAIEDGHVIVTVSEAYVEHYINNKQAEEDKNYRDIAADAMTKTELEKGA